MKNLIVFFCLATIGVACTPPKVDHFGHIQDREVKRVLSAACESSGGMATYLEVDSVIYEKRSILYLPDGSKESEVTQHHAYQLSPSLTGIISWKDSTGHHEIVYSAEDPHRTLDGKRTDHTAEAVAKSFMGSYFVLFIPYKMADPMVDLRYEGDVSIDNKTYDILSAHYAPEEHANHSTDDVWTLFCSKEDGSVLSNLVHHPPTYAYIENKEYTDEHPLRMNTYRQTWRTDKDRKKEYLRGEFWYWDYRFVMRDN